jgi:2-polyprenyl-3-methyl-5-hydroxy-6-metoxy-1,4-benzoquinol methylase
VLLKEPRARVARLGFDYDRTPKDDVGECNLCGGGLLVTLTHADRYGFGARTCACQRCGLAFLSPRPTASAYAEFYATTYRPLVSAFHGRQIDAVTVEDDQRMYAASLLRLLGPLLQERNARSVLDVGGSTGLVAEAVATAFGLSATVLDPSPDELARADARGLATASGTIESFEHRGAPFDVVLVCQTIDHLLDVAGTLRKLRSLLASNGLLFVDIVDFRAAYLRAWSVEAATKIDHPYSLTEATAEAFLARAGFSPLHKDYAADHLHVGYCCVTREPDPDGLPSQDVVERFFREIRYVQNAPPRPQ